MPDPAFQSTHRVLAAGGGIDEIAPAQEWRERTVGEQHADELDAHPLGFFEEDGLPSFAWQARRPGVFGEQ